MQSFRLGRRHLLRMTATVAVCTSIPRIGSASRRDPRLVVIILRGAMDGLAVVAPTHDPAYLRVRGGLAFKGGLPLDADFVLNPKMPSLYELFLRKEALLAHATATPYRSRSHFDGQDVLESGFPARGEVKSGWLNRALAALPLGERATVPPGVAIDNRVPLVLRGDMKLVGNWNIRTLAPADEVTRTRLLELYEATDPQLAEAMKTGLKLEETMIAAGEPSGPATAGYLAQQAAAASDLLRRQDGARIAVLSSDGWDTHRAETPVGPRGLGGQLVELDEAVGVLRAGLADCWHDTVILVVTEFGRTVRVNGSDGSDHGTATVSFLFGGAVNGGRVLADWPGLREDQLFEGRDLRPTLDLRALCKGVLADHFGLGRQTLDGKVFPESSTAAAVQSLIV